MDDKNKIVNWLNFRFKGAVINLYELNDLCKTETALQNGWSKTDIRYAISEYNSNIRKSEREKERVKKQAEKEASKKLSTEELQEFMQFELSNYLKNSYTGEIFDKHFRAIHSDKMRSNLYKECTNQFNRVIIASQFNGIFDNLLKTLEPMDIDKLYFESLLDKSCESGSISKLARYYGLNERYLRLIILAICGRGLGDCVDFQVLPVLYGKQGSGKTEFCIMLQKAASKSNGDVVYCSLGSRFSSEQKDELLKRTYTGVGIVDEVGQYTKYNDIEQIKSYISMKTFIFRPPYAPSNISCRVKNVIIATSNNNACLPSGDGYGRRYMWLEFHKPKEFPTQELFDNAIIEGVHLYNNGFRPTITCEDYEEFSKQYRLHCMASESLIAIKDCLETLAERGVSLDTILTHKSLRTSITTAKYAYSGAIIDLPYLRVKSSTITNELNRIATPNKKGYTLADWLEIISNYINDENEL